MSTFRYQSNSIDLAFLKGVIDPSLVIGASATVVYVDITLSNDALKPDLDIAMAQKGFVPYVGSYPTGSAPPLTILSPSGTPWNVYMTDTGVLTTVGPTGATGPTNSGITVKDEGTGITGPGKSALNFVGPIVRATANPANPTQADITIVGPPL
jgi:hypothetical protein